MKFRIVLEFDPEAGSFSACAQSSPAALRREKPRRQGDRTIEEAIRLYLAPAEIEFIGKSPLALPGVGRKSEAESVRSMGAECQNRRRRPGGR